MNKSKNNEAFLASITESFHQFLEKGTSISTDKLKPLHGFIAADIASRLGNEYTVFAQGYAEGKEELILGRYLNKMVDITIKKGDKVVAGIAVKFVMQNYSQNSNNYFENMLGETANIRSANTPYFQVFIVFDKMPYYNKDKVIKRWESFTEHNSEKYIALSKDDISEFKHTPNKTLLCIAHLPEPDHELHDKKAYIEYYRTKQPTITFANGIDLHMDNAVIVNDYSLFSEKAYHTIKSI